MADMMDTFKKLPYKYEFAQEELAEIRDCNETHGFAVVKELLPTELVGQLKESVIETLESTCDAAAGATNLSGNFIELSSPLARLLNYEPYMRIVRSLYRDKPITLNRSAAIYKKPGAPAGPWHTDWEPLKGRYGANAVLNNSGASSNWFYLNGTHPSRAGLAVIPDSHLENWPGPQGFEFVENRHSFYRKGTEPRPYDGMDFPEVFPLFTDPGDLIIFAERTYHGVFTHNGTEVRLSCAVSFRANSYAIKENWPLPESAKNFIASSPSEVRHLVENYLGFDGKWRANPDKTEG